jgi:hypothetical protein
MLATHNETRSNLFFIYQAIGSGAVAPNLVVFMVVYF